MTGRPRATGPRTMLLADFLSTFTNGDQTTWDDERAWIETHHPNRLARIQREIAHGWFPAVQVDPHERRVIDGHHRIVAAIGLGLSRVPYADAWADGNHWWKHADDSGADDPHPPHDDTKETTR